MTARVIILISVLALVFSPARAETPATQPAPAALSIVRVLDELTREALTAREKGEPFPRTQCNYAQARNVTVPNAHVVAALARRQHGIKEIDGYVRWQLLSFNPDFSKADATTLRTFIANLPELTPQTEPVMEKNSDPPTGMAVDMQMVETGRQSVPANVPRSSTPARPVVDVANSGAQMKTKGTVSPDGRHVVMDIEAAQAELIRLREIAVAANAPVVIFRDAAIAALPADQGVRIAAMIKDLRERVGAGDPSTPDAVRRTVEEAQKTPPGFKFAPDLRMQTQGRLRELASARRAVTVSIEADEKGNPVYKRQYVLVLAEDMKAIIIPLGFAKEFGLPPATRPAE